MLSRVQGDAAPLLCRGRNRFVFTKSDGQEICRRCRKCPRGYGRVQRCGEMRDTVCKVCPEGTFSRKRGRKCKKCRKCPSGSVIVRSCSPFLNTKCRRKRCKKGSFKSTSKKCKQCTVCPPGTFVDRQCTKKRDAVCLPCPQGTYSNEYNLFPFCKICKHCRRFEDITQICNATQNNICGECRLGEFIQIKCLKRDLFRWYKHVTDNSYIQLLNTELTVTSLCLNEHNYWIKKS